MGTHLKKMCKVFFLLFTVFFLTETHAQINNLRFQNYSEEENIKLSELGNQFNKEYIINKTRANKIATERGWPIRQVDSNGTVKELMGLDEHGIPIYYTTANYYAAITTRTNLANDTSGAKFGLTGKYYTIGIWDGGAVRSSHVEFGGRVIYKDTVRTIESHPTHVAGTMIAAGKKTTARGMAYEANLWAYSWDNDLSEMTNAAKQGLLISNHSYGSMYGWYYDDKNSEYIWFGDTTISQTTDYHFGFYSTKSESLDKLAFDAKSYLMVFAAHNVRGIHPPTLNTIHKVFYGDTSFYSTHYRDSNDGFDCLNDEGVAKNVLTVGAVERVMNYKGSESVIMSGFSAWGPTDDGRIKPDIVGDGVGVYSADYQSNTSYGTKSGTSMATPNVSGSLLLLQEQYNLNTGNFLNAAALKALAIHTADEAGPNQGPDYMFGWGLMNTKKAIDVINNEGGYHTIKNGILFKNTHLDYNLTPEVPSTCRVTIVWTDPAGQVSAPALNNRTPKLVNDLDIRVIDPADGETFYPWRLDPENPANGATKGDNFRDNVEVIDIPYLPVSNYVVRVSHKGTLANNQAYSLIITQKPIEIPTLIITASPDYAICPGKQIQFKQSAEDNFFEKYAWSFPGGTPSSYVGQTPPKITYNTPGDYEVLLVASNQYVTRTYKYIKKVHVNSAIIEGTANIQQICGTHSAAITIDTSGNFKVNQVKWLVNGVTRLVYVNNIDNLYKDRDHLKNGDVVNAIINVSTTCLSSYNIVTNSIVVQIPEGISKIPLNISPTSSTFCENSNIKVVAHTDDTSNGGYSWYKNGNFYLSSGSNTVDISINNYDIEKGTIEIYCIYNRDSYCNEIKYDTSSVLVLNKIEPYTPVINISTPKTHVCNGEWVEILETTNVSDDEKQVEWYLNGNLYTTAYGGIGLTVHNGDKVYSKLITNNACLSPSEVTSNVIEFIGTDMLFPTISIQATKTYICANEVVTFTADVTDKGSNPTYNWYLNGEIVQSGANSTYTSGVLKDKDEVRCIMIPYECTYNQMAHSNLISMTVVDANYSKVSISADDTSVCSGTPVTFTAVLINPGFSPTYKWRINGTLVSSTSDNHFITNTLNDGDVVDCYISQQFSCFTQTPYSNPIKIQVIQKGPPAVTIDPITSLCNGKEITFEASASATMATSQTNYQWIVNGVTKQNNLSNLFTSTELKTGDFIHCVMFTNAECATSNTGTSNYYPITLKSDTQNPVTIEQQNFKICENEPVEFVMYGDHVELGTLTQYQWKINDQVVAIYASNLTFSTTALKNNDKVSAIFYTDNECLDKSDYLSNEIPIEIINASPTISIGSYPICNGEPVTFFANATDAPAGSLYYWKKNGGYEQTGENAFYYLENYNAGDVISCTLIPKACTDSEEYYSNEIIIPELADYHPSVSIQVEGSFCQDQFTTFTAIPKNEGENPVYMWYKNGNLIFTDNNPNLIITSLQEGDTIICALQSSEPCAISERAVSIPFVVPPISLVSANLNLTVKNSFVCEGQLQEFQATSSIPENQSTYSWYINDVPVENAISSTWSSTTLAPNDRVTCSVQSNLVCIDPNTNSKTVESNIFATVYPTVTIQSNSNILCKGQGAVFIASVSNAGVNPIYEWFINQSSVQKSTSNTYYTAQLNDGDRLICVVTPDGICTQDSTISSDELTLTILDAETPTVSLKNLTHKICENGLAEFQVDATHSGLHPIYDWKINGSIVQSGEDYNFKTTELKDGDIVSCTLNKNDPCSGQQIFESNTISITLVPRTTPSVEITPTQNEYCKGSPVELLASQIIVGATSIYNWYINDSLVYISSSDTLLLTQPQIGDIVYCIMNTSAECLTTNEVQSNSYTIQLNDSVSPTISISTSNNNSCAGSTVLFASQIANGGSQPVFDWRVNDISVQKGDNNSFSSNTLKEGDIIQCILESNAPCAVSSAAVSNEIEMHLIPILNPSVSIAATNNNACQGEIIRFTASYANASQPQFSWKVNGQEVQKGTEIVFESNALNNNDIVSCELVTVSQCSTQPISVTSNAITAIVMESVSPSISISADKTEICAGTTVLFTSQIANGGSQPVFDWRVNDISVQKGDNNSFSSNTLKEGDIVTATLFTNAVCTNLSEISSNAVKISVIPVLQPSIQISASQTTVCSESEIEFTANAKNTYNDATYEWKVNDITVQLGASQQFQTSSLKDRDKVSCILRVNHSCASSQSVTSNIVEIQVIEPIQPTIEIKNHYDTICKDTKITLELNMVNVSSGTQFQWYKNGVLVGSVDQLIIDQLSQGDEIWCKISTQSVNCEVEVSAVSDTFTAIVYPETEFEVNQKGDTLFATAGYLAYNWYLDGKLIAKGKDNYIVPQTAGEYTVNIIDPNGCSGISKTIYFVPTYIKNSKEQVFKIYPNPTDGKINIEFSNIQSGDIQVYHINGQLMMKNVIVKNQKNYLLDISNLSEGVYIVTFEGENSKWSEKIIKIN